MLWHRRTNGLIFFLNIHSSTPQLQDWDKNIYFNCSSEAVGSREACGVPFRFLSLLALHIFAFTFAFTYFLSHIGLHIFALTYWPYLPETFTYLLSCCKPKDNELIKNKQCGYDVRKQDYVSTHHSSMLFYHNIRLKIIILIIPGKSYIINLLLVN